MWNVVSHIHLKITLDYIDWNKLDVEGKFHGTPARRVTCRIARYLVFAPRAMANAQRHFTKKSLRVRSAQNHLRAWRKGDK